ncbi:MAG: MarR family winged helix-turn-helix transcriptional regulator [Elsteraceae bacterium]
MDMNDEIPLTEKLLDGLERFAAAMRIEVRRGAETMNLNPAQTAVLKLLHAHARTGLRVQEVARHMGVRQPTATESINALVRKGLVTRSADPADARAVILRAVPPEASAPAPTESATAAALEDLSEQERAALLGALIKLIRGLQVRGAIPPQRLCVTCRHFRPHLHDHPETPHHCALVDAAFGRTALRLDCAEHEPAEADVQAASWNRLQEAIHFEEKHS